MMLFGSFHEIRIVPSDPCRITLGKTLILRLLELFDGGAFSVATLIIEHRRIGMIFDFHTN